MRWWSSCLVCVDTWCTHHITVCTTGCEQGRAVRTHDADKSHKLGKKEGALVAAELPEPEKGECDLQEGRQDGQKIGEGHRRYHKVEFVACEVEVQEVVCKEEEEDNQFNCQVYGR